MNILIADKLSSEAVKLLENLGATVRMEPGLRTNDLPGTIGNADILIVRSTKVDAATIDGAPALSLIIRAGAGVNTIDLDRASKRGIYVSNCPGKNADAVAELAMGLIIAADRRIANQSADLRNGKWDKKNYGKALGLKGRVLGILGLGSIGRAVASRAKAFGMPVAAWSRSLSPEIAEVEGIEYCATPEELARKADVLSVHLAATKETIGLLNTGFFAKMKSDSIVVNTSRGEIIDQSALLKAIDEKNLKVALDVYAEEPSSGDNNFTDIDLAKKITGTHHVGASTDQAANAIALEVVRIVAAYKKTGKPLNQVNAQKKSTIQKVLVVRHYSKVGVLASVLDALRQKNINVEEMENALFSGGSTAVCIMKIDKQAPGSLISELKENSDIIQVTKN